LIATTGILQNKHCLWISTNFDVFPENMGPKMSSRYPFLDGDALWLDDNVNEGIDAE
jgi:hypothetical protein